MNVILAQTTVQEVFEAFQDRFWVLSGAIIWVVQARLLTKKIKFTSKGYNNCTLFQFFFFCLAFMG